MKLSTDKEEFGRPFRGTSDDIVIDYDRTTPWANKSSVRKDLEAYFCWNGHE